MHFSSNPFFSLLVDNVFNQTKAIDCGWNDFHQSAQSEKVDL
jgi:hypothetical protein